MTLLEKKPEFGKWLSKTYGREELIRLTQKADKTGDYSAMKAWMKEFSKQDRGEAKSKLATSRFVGKGVEQPEVGINAIHPNQATNYKPQSLKTDINLQRSYAVRVADCILKDKESYLSLDWYHENHLRLFTEKFYEIEKIRDKLVFEKPTAKREKELLKKIGHSKTNALRFLIHAQETGKENHQRWLLNLLACNGE